MGRLDFRIVKARLFQMAWKTKASHRAAENTNPRRGLNLKYANNLTVRKEIFKWAKCLARHLTEENPLRGATHRKSPMGKQKDEEAACCTLRRMWSVSLGVRLLAEK